MYEMLMKQMTERENVTEPLNAPDRMKWVHRMNNIRNRATEIVNTDLINSLRTSVAAPPWCRRCRNAEKSLFVVSGQQKAPYCYDAFCFAGKLLIFSFRAFSFCLRPPFRSVRRSLQREV